MVLRFLQIANLCKRVEHCNDFYMHTGHIQLLWGLEAIQCDSKPNFISFLSHVFLYPDFCGCHKTQDIQIFQPLHGFQCRVTSLSNFSRSPGTFGEVHSAPRASMRRQVRRVYCVNCHRNYIVPCVSMCFLKKKGPRWLLDCGFVMVCRCLHQVQRFGHAASGHFARAGGYPLLGERSEPLRTWEQLWTVSAMAHVTNHP